MAFKPSAFQRFRNFLTPRFMKPYVKIIQEEGFKSFFKKAGPKVIVIIVLYYLIRDSILYLLIPYLIARGIFQ